MTMEELTKQLDVMDEKCEEAMLKVHNKEEGFMYYAQTLWDSMPRIPFKELPKEVQNRVLDSTNYDELFTFWEDCDFGADEVEISDEELRELLKKAVKVATYTITRDANGEIHADLYGDALTEAWSPIIQEYLKNRGTAAKAEAPKRSTKSKRKIGLTAGAYQMTISDKNFQHALTTKPNKHAYISVMNPTFFESLDYSNGIITYDGNEEFKSFIISEKKDKEGQLEVDFNLLTQIYTAVVKSAVAGLVTNHTITVDKQKFYNEMGVRFSSGHSQDFEKKYRVLNTSVGIIPEKKISAKVFSKIEETENTMTFAVPYLIRLIEELNDSKTVEVKKTKTQYALPYNQQLIKSTICKEKNESAVELARFIVNGLMQRGVKPRKGEDKIVYRISFKTLIEKTVILNTRLQSAPNTRTQNIYLRRAFPKAFELLKTQTDVYKYFKNLRIDQFTPSMKNLESYLVITHEGKNPQYRPLR